MGKNQSASGLTNIIQYDNNGNVSFVSGSTTLMQISSSGAITTTGVISGSNALSASFSLNSGLLNETGSVGFATTASLLAVSSSQQQISASQQQISSSLLALTASYNALSSSYTALSASYNTFSGSASTRITANSSSIQQVSSSQQQISASLLNVISIFATTGSNSFRANQSITGSLVVSSTITAQTLVVQTVTSSIVYSSGSNIFGSALSDRQTFTGSMNVTGSGTFAGSLTANNLCLTSTGAIYFNEGLALFPYGGHTYIRPYSASGSINFQNQTGSLLATILDGGNVGLNCTDPKYTLDVNGLVNINAQATGCQGTVQSLRISSNIADAAVTINACSLLNYTYLAFAQNCVGKFEIGFSRCTDTTSPSTFYLNPNVQSGACNAAIFIKSNGCVGVGRGCVEFTLDVNGDIALNRQNRLHFASSNAGDRCRSFLAGDFNNNIFVCGPSSNAIAAFMHTGTVCTYNLLNAAGGVKFGCGATTLNYYEQGTWTPRLQNGSFTSNAGSGNAGWYTRIGNLVTVGGTIAWGAGSGAQDGNSLQIACLPFASSNVSNERNVGQPGAPAAGSIGFKCTGKGQLVLVNDPGASYIYLIETFQNGTYTDYIHSLCVANAGTLYGFQITYHI